MFYPVLYRTTLITAVDITAAALVPAALVGPDIENLNSADANSARVTQIYMNQLRPSISELQARATYWDKANSNEDLAFKRRGQWI
jgi:hypothetical protein